jgi:hypothetical protein
VKRAVVVTFRGTVRFVPGTEWTEEQKAEALRICSVEGIAAAKRALGIPKPTLSRWCTLAGVELPVPVPRGPEAAAQVAAANDKTRVTVAQRRSRIVGHLTELAELGLEVALDKMRMAKAGDDEGLVTVRDAVGVFTRAIHDMQLLDGQATERHDVPTGEGSADPRRLVLDAQATVATLHALPSAGAS